MRIARALLALQFSAAACADTYLRQEAVDVLHYDIAVELEGRLDALAGTVRLDVRMRRDGVSAMRLDLADMKVESVRVGRTARPFTHRDGRLEFDFDRPYKKGEIAAVEVRYSGHPKDKGMLIGTNRHGRPVWFAENWPDHARYWFPSIDHPSDKATVDLSVTAPEKYDVVGPGRLVESRSLLDGRRLTRWSESVPIPTYCMVLGAAEFSRLAGSFGTIPLAVYAYPPDAGAAARKFARTGLGVRDSASVTVVAPDATGSDALATALSVIEPSAGLKLADSLEGVAAFMVQRTAGGLRTYASRRMQNRLDQDGLNPHR
ncbi:MAG: hypothetical protein DMG07_22935 [Acidobacteria bacterium]|nr:MAG: hypothetical protein DMG07_22935 [Acidobacteriota bacterium]